MRHRTRFFITKADEEIRGVLLDFYGHLGVHSIWLRGKNEAIKKLLGVLTYDKMMFPSTFPEHEELVKQRFLITAQYSVDFMLLKGGASIFTLIIPPDYSAGAMLFHLPVQGRSHMKNLQQTK